MHGLLHGPQAAARSPPPGDTVPSGHAASQTRAPSSSPALFPRGGSREASGWRARVTWGRAAARAFGRAAWLPPWACPRGKGVPGGARARSRPRGLLLEPELGDGTCGPPSAPTTHGPLPVLVHQARPHLRFWNFLPTAPCRPSSRAAPPPPPQRGSRTSPAGTRTPAIAGHHTRPRALTTLHTGFTTPSLFQRKIKTGHVLALADVRTPADARHGCSGAASQQTKAPPSRGLGIHRPSLLTDLRCGGPECAAPSAGVAEVPFSQGWPHFSLTPTSRERHR